MEMETQTRIHELFENAKAHSISLRTSNVKERKKHLTNLQNWILKNRQEIKEAVFKDLSKPPEETDITEILVVLNEIKEVKRNLSSWMSKGHLTGGLLYLGTRTHVHYEPKGVCLIISPWNFPFQLAMGPVISALAAGNTLILKPSEHSHHTSALLAKMFDEVFDPKLASVVEGGVPESQELLKLPFNHIFFTGSPEIGKVVMGAAAKNLASVTLELGGKSPVIVDKTASIKDAAQKIVWGKYMNAGQVCIAPDYMIVHKSIKNQLLDEMSLQVDKQYGKQENYAAIININHHNRINDLMTDAIEKGANIEFGGKSKRDKLRFSPTALTGFTRDARILKEEIFGPILPVLSFEDLDDVVKIINEQPKALSLYMFSNSRKNIKKIKKETSAGMMVINETVFQFAHPSMPFGGVNNSGIGKSHGKAGFMAFSNAKGVMRQVRGLTTIKLLYPPYSVLKRKLINIVLKYL